MPRASLSVTTANATATTTATQMDQVVPCSETYFMFSAVTLKYEGTSQKAVSPYASTGMAMAGTQDALVLPGDPEAPDQDGVEHRQRGGAVEIVGHHAGGEHRGQRDGPRPPFFERQPGEGQRDGDQRQRAHVRTLAVLDQHAQPLRLAASRRRRGSAA